MGLIWKKRKLEIRMLILVAIEEELKRSELPDHEIEYISAWVKSMQFLIP